jgi:small subunit ribosomal protein S6
LRIAKPDDILKVRDIFSLLAFKRRARDQKEVNSMNKYELAVVVSAMIEDDARTAVVDKCKALVERFGGKIADVDEWGKKKLAYEIEKMTEGFYYFIHFEAEGDAIAEIEHRIRIMDGVIRYLCVRQDEA